MSNLTDLEHTMIEAVVDWRQQLKNFRGTALDMGPGRTAAWIELEARIVALGDAVDALLAERKRIAEKEAT